jgi:hypothetical protein
MSLFEHCDSNTTGFPTSNGSVSTTGVTGVEAIGVDGAELTGVDGADVGGVDVTELAGVGNEQAGVDIIELSLSSMASVSSSMSREFLRSFFTVFLL